MRSLRQGEVSIIEISLFLESIILGQFSVFYQRKDKPSFEGAVLLNDSNSLQEALTANHSIKQSQGTPAFSLRASFASQKCPIYINSFFHLNA